MHYIIYGMASKEAHINHLMCLEQEDMCYSPARHAHAVIVFTYATIPHPVSLLLKFQFVVTDLLSLILIINTRSSTVWFKNHIHTHDFFQNNVSLPSVKHQSPACFYYATAIYS